MLTLFSLSAAKSLPRRRSPILCDNVSGRAINGVQLFAVESMGLPTI